MADSDRIGAGVMHDGKIVYLSGNQTGALFVDFLARMRQSAGKKLITSIITGDMGQDIAAAYGVETIRTFTGFKDLAAEMNRHREDEILMADLGKLRISYRDSYQRQGRYIIVARDVSDGGILETAGQDSYRCARRSVCRARILYRRSAVVRIRRRGRCGEDSLDHEEIQKRGRERICGYM